MKAIACFSLLFLLSASPRTSSPPTPITGDYLEARTASVFAGACHYNGELVTTGRDAIMVWHFTSGTWNGVNLSGLCAVAAVSSENNLGEESGSRQSELVIDENASETQASALTNLLKEKCGQRLGTIIVVRRGPITFDYTDRAYAVQANGFANMSVRPMPNNECCSQPHLVWYRPLFSVEHPKVGFTVNAAYSAGKIGDPWQRSGENSAFYGTFSL